MCLNDDSLTHNTRTEFDPPLQGLTHAAAKREAMKQRSTEIGVAPALKGAMTVQKSGMQ
jgi:hypothetical protein